MRILYHIFHRDQHSVFRKMRNNTLKQDLVKLINILLLVMVLHTALMMWFEGLSPGDAAWLTITTATTVGYGDISAETTWGRWSTLLLMYIAGIALLAQVMAMYFDYRALVKDQMMRGKWRWKMNNHIVFLNCPAESGLAYFEKVLHELRASSLEKAQKPVVIVSDKLEGGLTDKLRELEVVHVSKPVTSNEALNDANVAEADTIAVLSENMYEPVSDSLNFDLIHKLRGRGVKSTIIAEVLQDENKARVKQAGADHVMRPIRSYPELLVRTILAPGTEQFVEDLFDVEGEECIRYDVEITVPWGEVAGKMIAEDIGTPLAFLTPDNEVICSVPPKETITAKAFFVLVRDGNIKDSSEVQSVLLS